MHVTRNARDSRLFLTETSRENSISNPSCYWDSRSERAGLGRWQKLHKTCRFWKHRDGMDGPHRREGSPQGALSLKQPCWSRWLRKSQTIDGKNSFPPRTDFYSKKLNLNKKTEIILFKLVFLFKKDLTQVIHWTSCSCSPWQRLSLIVSHVHGKEGRVGAIIPVSQG